MASNNLTLAANGSMLTNGLPWAATPGTAAHAGSGNIFLRPNGLSGLPAAATHKKKQSKFQRMLYGVPEAERIELDYNDKKAIFFNINTEILIGSLGNLNPLRNGRPTPYVQGYLNAATADCKLPYVTTGMSYLHGIVYKTPYVPGRRCCQYRLSVAGLGLLDHWATKFPKFKPFVDAYVTEKARLEIHSDCVDFAMGIMPIRFKKLLDQQIDAIAKEMARQKQAMHVQQAFQQQQILLQQQFNQQMNALGAAANRYPISGTAAMQQSMLQQTSNQTISQAQLAALANSAGLSSNQIASVMGAVRAESSAPNKGLFGRLFGGKK